VTPHQIILRPVVTEKSTALMSDLNQYTFEVARAANKIEIRKAIEMVFGVRVSKVRTQVCRGDVRRVGAFIGRRKWSKKAIVTLHPDDSINLYGED
jgi:large subunit ribosomal protein L23